MLLQSSLAAIILSAMTLNAFSQNSEEASPKLESIEIKTHGFIISIEDHKLRFKPDRSLEFHRDLQTDQNQDPTVTIEIPAPPIIDQSHPLNTSHLSDPLNIWRESIEKSIATGESAKFLSDVLVPGSVSLHAQLPLEDKGADKKSLDLDELKLPKAQILAALDKKFAVLMGLNRSDLHSYKQIKYKVRCRRVDTIAVDEHGRLHRIAGTPRSFSPEPPDLQKPLYPVLNVNVPPDGQALSYNDLVPVEVSRTEALVSTPNPGALKSCISKLNTGKGLKIVFWGDSITAGGFADSPKYFFVQRFLAGLKERFPDNAIAFLNRGVAGSNSSWRLPGFEQEVLSLHPDLLVIEFVNDYALPPDILSANYRAIVSKARSHGLEIILCLPHLPSPSYLKLNSWHQVAESNYPKLLREICLKEGLALVDLSKRWDLLEREGLKPSMLLADGMLHPNNYGHQIYADELLTQFPIRAVNHNALRKSSGENR